MFNVLSVNSFNNRTVFIMLKKTTLFLIILLVCISFTACSNHKTVEPNERQESDIDTESVRTDSDIILRVYLDDAFDYTVYVHGDKYYYSNEFNGDIKEVVNPSRDTDTDVKYWIEKVSMGGIEAVDKGSSFNEEIIDGKFCPYIILKFYDKNYKMYYEERNSYISAFAYNLFNLIPKEETGVDNILDEYTTWW